MIPKQALSLVEAVEGHFWDHFRGHLNVCDFVVFGPFSAVKVRALDFVECFWFCRETD